MRYPSEVSTLILEPLADVLKLLVQATEDESVRKAPKAKTPPSGRYVYVEALKKLIDAWRKKAGEENWGLNIGYDACADDLEQLIARTEDSDSSG